MTEPPAITFIGEFDESRLGDDAVAEVQLFSAATTTGELRAMLREEVDREVTQFLDLVTGCDAYDVVQCLRVSELAGGPQPTEATQGSALVIEIVAAALLGRGSRAPTDHDPQITGAPTRPPPRAAFNQLRASANRLARLATYRYLHEARVAAGTHALAKLAADYQSAQVSIRNHHFDSVRNEIEQALFGQHPVTNLMSDKLGYTYADLVTIREALPAMGVRRFEERADRIAEFVARHPNPEHSQATAEERVRFEADRAALLSGPGQRAAFAAEDVAAHTGMPVETTRHVLHAYAQRFDAEDSPTDRVFDILVGERVFYERPLLLDEAGHFLPTSLAPGIDTLRGIVETTFKQHPQVFAKYRKVRTTVSENLSVSYLEQLLGASATHTGLHYLAPNATHDVADLGPECTNHHQVGDDTEGDALFLIEDVAICVEVKARSIAAQSRRGDTVRLARDLENTVGEASDQAHRLETLIATNGGLWLPGPTWLDLSHVREIRSVAVMLDDFGPAGVALDELRSSGVITATTAPWVVSLHDLDVASKVIASPAEFLLYLRRRTDSGVATHFYAVDELDLLMLFLEGEMYVEEDPDLIRSIHPNTPPVTDEERQRHQESAMRVIVGSRTAPLDAWMHNQAQGGPPIAKPQLPVDPDLQQLLDQLAYDQAPGSFRFGADLLHLNADSQREAGRLPRDLAQMTRLDGQPHRVLNHYPTRWGFPTFFVQSYLRGSEEAAKRSLLIYMRLKRHQLKSDRSLGLLVNETGEIATVIYANDEPTEDAELDALVAASGLRPTDE